MFTVGPVAENCFIIRHPDATDALIIDPGEEPERLLEPIKELGLDLKGILITHCHFDHVGAVKQVAEATGAEVWCPEGELHILADINSYVRMPGFGPFENYEAEHSVTGGDVLELAGFTLDVIDTPGHSPGHVTYSVRDHNALFSGDVLFEGSVGRVDLPGGDWPTLLGSIQRLVEGHPAEAQVFPGHGGPTTLARELATNPFLAELSDGDGRQPGGMA